MRPKGWRLDPAWREHFAKIEQERSHRELERQRAQFQAIKLQVQVDDAMRRLKEPSLYFTATDPK